MSNPKLDIFLSPEERFDIYSVKAEERPHLLPTYSSSVEENKKEEEDELPPPLVDGCDISTWRAQGFVKPTLDLEAVLNVGIGCSLLRRESQLPLPLMSANEEEWKKLRDLLLKSPVTDSVEVISCEEASREMEKHENTTNTQQQQLSNDTALQRRKQFSKWEEANYPVIISGCTKNWNLEHWKFENLVTQSGDVRWRFSDTHGALLSLDTYAKYIQSEGLLDDAPLGVYDSEFGNDDSPMNDLVHDYIVPPCFSEDLFALVDDLEVSTANEENVSESSDTSSSSDSTENNRHQTRPPWRWILMGPPRSGTGLHIDPLWTNAWVTLLEGIKRWILIPPELTSQLPPGAGLQEPQVPSAIWFHKYYEYVSQMEGVVEILQYPGDTVFVPNGWPHLVINLERTVAVTHNYASEFGPFERMWKQVAQDEPEFAQRWYRGLCRNRPDLASRIQSSSAVAGAVNDSNNS